MMFLLSFFYAFDDVVLEGIIQFIITRKRSQTSLKTPNNSQSKTCSLFLHRGESENFIVLKHRHYVQSLFDILVRSLCVSSMKYHHREHSITT